MSKFKFLFIVLVIFLSPSMVSAHPGRLDKNGCHTCRTNCSKYGLSNGQYHCHNGNSSTSTNSNKTTSNSSKSKSSSQTNTKTTTITKSKDVSLKSLTINNDKINIKDNMSYKTNSSIVTLNPTPSSSKAIVKYDNKIELEDGVNKINIKVVAEDTSYSKTYTINITKLSSDTGLDIIINGEKVDIDSTIDIDTDSINLSYKTNHSGSKVEVEGYKEKLEYGENIIRFLVTAEDGSKKEYKLVVNRKKNKEIIEERSNKQEIETSEEDLSNSIMLIPTIGMTYTLVAGSISGILIGTLRKKRK